MQFLWFSPVGLSCFETANYVWLSYFLLVFLTVFGLCATSQIFIWKYGH